MQALGLTGGIGQGARSARTRNARGIRRLAALALLLAWALVAPAALAAGGAAEPAWPAHGQVASFPVPLGEYGPMTDGLLGVLESRIRRDPFNLAASVIFLLAILHTFATGRFNRWAHAAEVEHLRRLESGGDRPDDSRTEVSFKATLLHFLGEVEAVFGIWVIALAGAAVWFHSWKDFTAYVGHDRAFTEPMFVVVIMAIASSRPVLKFAEGTIRRAAGLGRESPAAWWFAILTLTPLLGSFITEPAAITIGALLLAKRFYALRPGPRFAYATLGLLFVNISIGGVLTHFAAPPVLMVATPWNWDTPLMIADFGWKAVIVILLSNLLYYAIFRREFTRLADRLDGHADGQFHPAPAGLSERSEAVPGWVTAGHVLFLAWTVFNAHQPVLFIGGFLFFLAFVIATGHHQDEIRLRNPLLVGFFLAGLIIHAGCQGWWIEPIIKELPSDWLMLGATVLTAFNDNAAITYLAAQVEGISPAAKLAVVAGAVAGGGLTVIANAPNPAGQSILSRFFKGGVSPLGLFLGALLPTVLAYAAFALLPNFRAVPDSPATRPPAAAAESARPASDPGPPVAGSIAERRQGP
jgi:hypothetical protein